MLKKVVVIFLFGFSLSLSGMAAEVQTPQRVILNWYGDPATTAAVTWRTETPALDSAAQVVQAGPNTLTPAGALLFKAESLPLIREKSDGIWTHSARFIGLKPNTLYAYRVGSGTSWSEWSQFRTARDVPGPFSFVYLGDTQNDLASQCSRVIRAAMLKAPNALFMVHAGDLVSRAWQDDKWGEWFQAGGWIYRQIPQLMVPGNHEYRRVPVLTPKDLTPLWRPHFTLPENGPAGLEETAFVLNVQGVRIVGLNPNTRIQEQASWLDGVLRTGEKAVWTVLLMHQPIYSTGRLRDNRALRESLLPIIDSRGVDLVLQGHDHTYGRTYRLRGGERVSESRGGTVYVVSVAGPKQYSINTKFASIMARMAADKQLFQVIRVNDKLLSFEAWTADNVLFDNFELRK